MSTCFYLRFSGDIPKLEEFLREHWAQIAALESPDVAAAYMEVVNMVRALPRSEGTALPKFEIPSGKPESALLRTQLVIYKVYSAYESAHPTQELRSVLFDTRFGVNSLIPALETIPQLWSVTKISDAQLIEFCDLYMEVCFRIGPAEPRVIALRNLTEILDQLLKTQQLSHVPVSSLAQLWNSLPSSLLNPALSNAIIRISGCMVAVLKQNQASSPAGLENWGLLMADAGLDDKVCGTSLEFTLFEHRN